MEAGSPACTERYGCLLTPRLTPSWPRSPAKAACPPSLWAGPEKIARGVRQGEYEVEALARRKPVSLKLGFSGETYGYSIDLGYPPASPPATAFCLDPGD
jgi:hypothetical protein